MNNIPELLIGNNHGGTKQALQVFVRRSLSPCDRDHTATLFCFVFSFVGTAGRMVLGPAVQAVARHSERLRMVEKEIERFVIRLSLGNSPITAFPRQDGDSRKLGKAYTLALLGYRHVL